MRPISTIDGTYVTVECTAPSAYRRYLLYARILVYLFAAAGTRVKNDRIGLGGIPGAATRDRQLP